MEYLIKKILLEYPETRNGFKPLLIKYAEIKGATEDQINFIRNLPLENLRRKRQKLIEDDRKSGANLIQPTNKKELEKQEFSFYHQYSPLRKARQEQFNLK